MMQDAEVPTYYIDKIRADARYYDRNARWRIDGRFRIRFNAEFRHDAITRTQQNAYQKYHISRKCRYQSLLRKFHAFYFSSKWL